MSNSSKKKSSIKNFPQENELFSLIQDQIEDQDLLIRLKRIEGDYYQLFPQNNRSSKRKFIKESQSVTLKSLSKQWKKIHEDCKIYFYNESLSNYFSNIKRCNSKIHESFLQLSSADSYPRKIRKKFDKKYDEDNDPNDDDESYEQAIIQFKEDFLQLMQVFNLKQYSKNFINSFKSFLKKIPKYLSIFSDANIDQEELTGLISTIQKKSNQIENYISFIEQTQIPSELEELDEIIQRKIDEYTINDENEEDNIDDYQDQRNFLRKTQFVNNKNNMLPQKNVPKMANSFCQPAANESRINNKNTKNVATQSELMSEIKSCCNRLKSISNNIDLKLDEESNNTSSNGLGNKNKKNMRFLLNLQDQIDSEYKHLKSLQKLEILPDDDRNSDIFNERQRNKMIFDILNKGQSVLAEDIDTEKLKKLNNSQLISIILSLCIMIKDSNSNENGKKNCRFQIPLELTFCQGTPEEFKRLSHQYIKTAKYNEWAENEIEKLRSFNIKLQQENEILSSQAKSKDDEYKLLNELRKIDDRIQIINLALEQKLQTNSNMKMSSQSLETTGLSDEVDELAKKKKRIKSTLKNIIPGQMIKEVEALNRANTQLQLINDGRLNEIENLRKQVSDLSSQIAKMDKNGHFIESQNNCYSNRNGRAPRNANRNGLMNDDFASNQFGDNQNVQNSGNFSRNNQFDDEYQNGSYVNRNSSVKTANKMNRNNNVQNDQEFNDPNSSYMNRSSSKMSRNNIQFNDDDEQNNGYINKIQNSSAKAANKMNRNNNVQNDQEFNDPNSSYMNRSSSKMSRSNSQFNDDDDQNNGYLNKSPNSSVKNVKKFNGNDQIYQNFNDPSKLNGSGFNNLNGSYISRINNSPNRNSHLNRNSNYENDDKNGFQDQISNNRGGKKLNNNMNRYNDQNIDDDDGYNENDVRNNHNLDTDDEIGNYIGNKNIKNSKIRNSSYSYNERDNDLYQDEGEKKINPRIRK